MVALHKAQHKQPRLKQGERPGRIKEVRNLDVWDRCAPVRLAGCDDDPAEPYIIRGID
ncbi:hypothetical protein SSP35_10_00670 [Streptomyces sp. NBRC 110611]|nr:hypothetical protein SSP35_10_00670 [Streptomyces sp. NBRC 110611]